VEYLFGDASPSPLDRNYLEYLRDLLDFSVAVLRAHVTATQLLREADDRASAAAIVQGQLRSIGERLEGTLQNVAGPQTTTAVAQAIATIRASQARELQHAEQEVRTELERELTKANQAIARSGRRTTGSSRSFCSSTICPTALIGSAVGLGAGDVYVAKASGRSRNGLSWVLSLAIPSDHLFAELVRVDRVVPLLVVKLPQESGWVRKSVKLRGYKLAKEVLTEISFAPGSATLKLRAAPQEEAGYDIVRSAKTHQFCGQACRQGCRNRALRAGPRRQPGPGAALE